MSITLEEKVEYFKEELDRIYDKSVREFTKLCIMQAPDYFFEDCPSSSTGKYHPLDEITPLGTLIHTKKVFTLAYEMVKALECDDNRDSVLAACIIHDLRKYGTVNSGHTVKDHGSHAVALIDEVQASTGLLTDKQHTIIRNCVGYHYGTWTTEAKWKKKLKDFTAEELVVHLSDFTVSKRFIKTDFRR
jgi:hypothetical protein